MAADYLFSTHLNSQIESNTEVNDIPEVHIADISSVDLHNCTYDDFCQVMEFVRSNYPEYYFSDASLAAIKPANYQPEEKYDFMEQADYAKHTAILIGNMTLFSELQKIVSAEEIVLYNRKESGDIDEEKAFSINSLFTNNHDVDATDYEIMASCVVGMGELNPYKLSAIKHASSTLDDPVVLIQIYSLNTSTYLPNSNIINLNAIDRRDATLMEAFAYMSYHDYIDGKHEHSFEDLINSGSLGVLSLEDMTVRRLDLLAYDKNRC
ncbi:MAG: hypothetical protein K6E79_05050 [Pseudobutyrivibrio sp.]|nr:hypothetical protein [Pseudobutyrivibrio sp.]